MKDPKISTDFINTKYSEKQIREFIKKYPEKANYYFCRCISHYQDLSEPFIREFKDQVNWGYISEFQNLSEPFIREFKDKVAWWRISSFQDLSEEFLIEFIKDIKIGDRDNYGLIHNKKIPEDVKNRIINLKKLLESD
jgi:hypothetical protein